MGRPTLVIPRSVVIPLPPAHPLPMPTCRFLPRSVSHREYKPLQIVRSVGSRIAKKDPRSLTDVCMQVHTHAHRAHTYANAHIVYTYAHAHTHTHMHMFLRGSQVL